MRNFVKIRKLILLGPKYPKIHLDSKFRKRKPVENSKFPQFWNVGSFQFVWQFFWSLWLVSGRYSRFRLVFALSGFSKYRKFLYGLQIISCMGPKIWDLALNKLTQVTTLNEFKAKIKNLEFRKMFLPTLWNSPATDRLHYMMRFNAS